MTETRIVPCPDCGGDAGHAIPMDIDRRDGSLIERWQPCVGCEATGEVEIELEPVVLDDIAIIPPGPWIDPHQPGADAITTSSTVRISHIEMPYHEWDLYSSLLSRRSPWLSRWFSALVEDAGSGP